MTRVGIVEDDRPQAEHVARMVARWDAGARVALYGSAEALLFELDRGFDILILDIQMAGMDGMALARRLRAAGETAQLIFVTALKDYAAEGYDVDAVNYLVKPVDEARLFRALDRARERGTRARRTVLIGDERFFADEIVSCEASGRDVLIRLTAGARAVKIAMGDLESLLGVGFFRCQRSFIAGLAHVRRVTRAALEMDDGTLVPLSRKLYDAANRAFIDHNWSER